MLEQISFYFPDLQEEQLIQLKRLKQLYTEWNQKINVISRKDMDAFYLHHVLHALSIGKLIQFRAGTKLLDVGTGGGFPAVPLAILFPDSQFVAVDAVGKKIKVLRAVAGAIGLKNIEAMHQRAEQVDEQFDFVLSRAVCRAKKIITWVDHLLKEDSFNQFNNGYLLLKGGDLKEELEETARPYKIYSLSDFFKEEFFETKRLVYLPSVR